MPADMATGEDSQLGKINAELRPKGQGQEARAPNIDSKASNLPTQKSRGLWWISPLCPEYPVTVAPRKALKRGRGSRQHSAMATISKQFSVTITRTRPKLGMYC